MKIRVVIACLFFFVGFFASRMTTPFKEKIRYIKMPTITGEIKLANTNQYPIFDGLKVPQIFWRVDSIQNTIHDTITVFDTLKIYKATAEDWNIERDYHLNLFDDSNGKMDVWLKVQYNALQSLQHTFTPIQVEKTIKKDKLLKPLISGVYSTDSKWGAGGGFFVKKIGLQFFYMQDHSKMIVVSRSF